MLERFGARDPELVEETAIATVFRVRRGDGTFAALKVYRDAGMANEAPGYDLLADLDGEGAARLLQRDDTAALIEWLPGPPLGDMSRSGRDAEASDHLSVVAKRLHGAGVPVKASYPRLETWFDALFRLAFAPSCDMSTRAAMRHGRDLARRLLATETDISVLHGDLHHDNIRLGPRGYLAFDPKGIAGERSFELANAFRNPKGMGMRLLDPSLQRARAESFSEALTLDQGRLLSWAAAKCALSITWRAKGTLSHDSEVELLELLLSLASQETDGRD